MGDQTTRPIRPTRPKGRLGRRAFIVMWGFRFGANRLIPGPFWEETGVLGDLLRVDSSFRGASPLLCVAVSRVPTRPPCMFLVVVCWIGVCVGVPAMPSGVWCTAFSNGLWRSQRSLAVSSKSTYYQTPIYYSCTVHLDLRRTIGSRWTPATVPTTMVYGTVR